MSGQIEARRTAMTIVENSQRSAVVADAAARGALEAVVVRISGGCRVLREWKHKALFRRRCGRFPEAVTAATGQVQTRPKKLRCNHGKYRPSKSIEVGQEALFIGALLAFVVSSGAPNEQQSQRLQNSIRTHIVPLSRMGTGAYTTNGTFFFWGNMSSAKYPVGAASGQYRGSAKVPGSLQSAPRLGHSLTDGGAIQGF